MEKLVALLLKIVLEEPVVPEERNVMVPVVRVRRHVLAEHVVRPVRDAVKTAVHPVVVVIRKHRPVAPVVLL